MEFHCPGRIDARFACHEYPDATKRYLCQFVTDVPMSPRNLTAYDGPPRLRSTLYAAVDAPLASPGWVSSTGLLLFHSMPSLLPRKISAAASVLQTAGHWPSPYVHWVGIFSLIDEATYRFACATACCFANWELTTPCCQDAAPLNYQGARTTPWAGL